MAVLTIVSVSLALPTRAGAPTTSKPCAMSLAIASKPAGRQVDD